MNTAMRNLLSIALLLAPLFASAKEPTMVAVFNTADKSTRTIITQTDLSEFHRLWSTKNKLEPAHKIDWPYSLKISIGNKSTLWLYHPSGWATVLSKRVVPMYKINSPEDFNHLLGIHNTLRNLTRGAEAPLAS